MTSSDLWHEATARRYDETASEMFEPEVLDPTVDLLAGLAGTGRALELAIGTGRVAVPLAARGVQVAGIELSEPMVARLRLKVDVAVVEVGVPQLRCLPPGQDAVPFDVSEGHLGLDTDDVVTQQATSHHVWTDADGSTRRGTHNFRPGASPRHGSCASSERGGGGPAAAAP